MGLTPSIDSGAETATRILVAPAWPRPLGALAQCARIVQQLCKTRLTGLAALTAVFGYLMHAGTPGLGALYSYLGVFLMACGGCALNQLQEKKYDALMLRTRQRPLVRNQISGAGAALLSAALLGTGALLLGLLIRPLAAALGVLAILWYNGVYTGLKRVTALAVIPGALIGAIPPAIGWIAAGGRLTDPLLIMVALFFFIWQLPHFWLLLMIHGRDYSRGGFPALTDRFSRVQLQWLTMTWILLLTLEACLIPLLGGARHPLPTSAGLIAVSLWMTAAARRSCTATPDPAALKRTFHSINLYMVMVMLLLCLDRFLTFVY